MSQQQIANKPDLVNLTDVTQESNANESIEVIDLASDDEDANQIDDETSQNEEGDDDEDIDSDSIYEITYEEEEEITTVPMSRELSRSNDSLPISRSSEDVVEAPLELKLEKKIKYVVTKHNIEDGHKFLAIHSKRSMSQLELLEKIFEEWGVAMGEIPAKFIDLSDAYANISTRETTLKLDELVRVIKVPNEQVMIMIYSHFEEVNVIDVDLSWSVLELKEQITKKIGTPVLQQSLFLNKNHTQQQLFDEAPLAYYEIKAATRLDMVIYDSGRECTSKMFDNKEFFVNEYNADYTNVQDDGVEYTRGGKPYFRPFGSFRYGIKVLDKHENDEWLGKPGHRTDSCPGEWAVAYHGTQEVNASAILQGGFDLKKCIRTAYGKGIYCSPDPRTALLYAQPFKYKDKIYRAMLQCRVHPSIVKEVKPGYVPRPGMQNPPSQPTASRGVLANPVPYNPSQLHDHGAYWLIPEDKVKAGEESKYIRPYGVCIYPSNDQMPKW